MLLVIIEGTNKNISVTSDTKLLNVVVFSIRFLNASQALLTLIRS